MAIPEYTNRLMIRVTPVLPRAIEVAAARQHVSASEYVRRSLIDRLRADGIDPSSITVAA